MNVVMTSEGEFVELQGSGEEATFTDAQLATMVALAKEGIAGLLQAQQSALANTASA